jgi:hypothetical protein
MSAMRMVAMSAEQAAELDRYIEDLMRRHKNARASLMMTLSLAYRFAPVPKPEPRSNVVELDFHSRRVGA